MASAKCILVVVGSILAVASASSFRPFRHNSDNRHQQQYPSGDAASVAGDPGYSTHLRSHDDDGGRRDYPRFNDNDPGGRYTYDKHGTDRDYARIRRPDVVAVAAPAGTGAAVSYLADPQGLLLSPPSVVGPRLPQDDDQQFGARALPPPTALGAGEAVVVFPETSGGPSSAVGPRVLVTPQRLRLSNDARYLVSRGREAAPVFAPPQPPPPPPPPQFVSRVRVPSTTRGNARPVLVSPSGLTGLNAVYRNGDDLDARYQYDYQVTAAGEPATPFRTRQGLLDPYPGTRDLLPAVGGRGGGGGPPPHFGANELRNGRRTDGRYYVRLPDGRVQVVDYYVDGDSGFVAKVSYIGGTAG